VAVCRGGLLGEQHDRTFSGPLLAISLDCPRPSDTPCLREELLGDDAMATIYAAHVQDGAASGRFALLTALAARLQRAELAAARSRMRLWAAQAGSGAEAAGGSLGDAEAEEDEQAVGLMSAAQLREMLGNEELAVLHNMQARAR
jgi:hypothetical protein